MQASRHVVGPRERPIISLQVFTWDQVPAQDTRSRRSRRSRQCAEWQPERESKAKQRLRWKKTFRKIIQDFRKARWKGRELDSPCDRMHDFYFLTMTAVFATTSHILTQLRTIMLKTEKNSILTKAQEQCVHTHSIDVKKDMCNHVGSKCHRLKEQRLQSVRQPTLKTKMSNSNFIRAILCK